MRAFTALTSFALSACAAEMLEESSLLQINNRKGDVDSDCFREGRCGPATTTPATTTTVTTTAPPELAASGICTVTGDPHIKPFDSKEQNVNFYYNGDFYLVKSKFVSIQGRYWSNSHLGQASVKALAIGGDIMEGSVLMIEPQVGVIRLDGQELTVGDASSMTIGTATLSSEPAVGKGKGHGPMLTLNFPNDDVTIKVKRLRNMLNIIIEMRPEKDQDGHCGNFNGDAADDHVNNIKLRMGMPLRFPETMFPVMAATLLGCSQEQFGEEVGTYLNTHECNMMCSQRGTQFMANKDETCYCGNGVAPSLLKASCTVECEDPAIVDPGFCIYSMAKPPSGDASRKCALDEKMVVDKCSQALTTTAEIESCKIDACATGDLQGTLSYLLDFKAADQKEMMKLEKKNQKEKSMSPAARKKKAELRQFGRQKKAENAKIAREKKNLNAKMEKDNKRTIKEAKWKKANQKLAEENARAQAKATAEREKLAATKKAAADKKESKDKKDRAEASSKREADAAKAEAGQKEAVTKKQKAYAKTAAARRADAAKAAAAADKQEAKVKKDRAEASSKRAADAAKAAAVADKEEAKVKKDRAAAKSAAEKTEAKVKKQKELAIAKAKAERVQKEKINKRP